MLFPTLVALPLTAVAASAAAISPRQQPSAACTDPAVGEELARPLGGREGVVHGRRQVSRGAAL